MGIVNFVLGLIGVAAALITIYDFVEKRREREIPYTPEPVERTQPESIEAARVLERTVLYQKYVLALTLAALLISAAIVMISWITNNDAVSGAFFALLLLLIGNAIFVIPVRFMLFLWIRRKYNSWGGGLSGIKVLEKLINDRDWYNKSWKRNTRTLLLRAAQGHLT